MADDTYYYDQIQVWSTNGWKTIPVKLPSIAGSSGKITLEVTGDEGGFKYGNFIGNGKQVNANDEGGLTLTFSNPSNAFCFIAAVALSTHTHGVGGIFRVKASNVGWQLSCV